MSGSRRRSGFSLIELLVVIAILAILFALLFTAIQKARNAATKVYCVNNLSQVGQAIRSYEAVTGAFPSGHDGHSPPAGQGWYPSMSWMVRILPYIEQTGMSNQSRAAYAAGYSPFYPPHPCDDVVKVYTCPGDDRVLQAQFVTQTNINQSFTLGLTSYLGVSGTALANGDGMLFLRSKIRSADVTDGLSNTLMVGERPPNSDLIFGWWYNGDGQSDTGSCDVVLVRARSTPRVMAFLPIPALPDPGVTSRAQ